MNDRVWLKWRNQLFISISFLEFYKAINNNKKMAVVFDILGGQLAFVFVILFQYHSVCLLLNVSIFLDCQCQSLWFFMHSNWFGLRSSNYEIYIPTDLWSPIPCHNHAHYSGMVVWLHTGEATTTMHPYAVVVWLQILKPQPRVTGFAGEGVRVWGRGRVRIDNCGWGKVGVGTG